MIIVSMLNFADSNLFIDSPRIQYSTIGYARSSI